MPQTSSFRSAKEILVVSFATQPRAFILSDRNIFYNPGGGGGGGEQRRGLMPLGLFLFSIVFFRRFFLVVTCPRLPLGQKTLAGNLRSFSIYSPKFSILVQYSDKVMHSIVKFLIVLPDSLLLCFCTVLLCEVNTIQCHA